MKTHISLTKYITRSVGLTAIAGAFAFSASHQATASGSIAEEGKPLTVAIKADNGGYWGRCNQCQKTVNDEYPDTVTIGEKSDEAKSEDQHFEMHKLKDGRFAFKAHTGNWVAMCTDCIVNGAKKDFITIHVKADKEDDIPSFAKFQLVELSDDKVAFKADNGKFVGRCTQCSPGAAYPEQVTAHLDDSDEPYAQWEIEDID
jgi:hypothetical protein